MQQILRTCLLVVLILSQSGSSVYQPLRQQAADPEVDAILARMSPEDRVGQMFLVTYYGSDTGADSDIAILIERYRIGGVVLLSANDNFTNESELPAQIYQLTTGLQSLAEERRQLPPTDVPGPPLGPSPYIPLFIGIDHEGSGGDHLQIYDGLTPLPSNMAIGATWDPAFAQGAGQVVGTELEALGINLLLGPPADVVLSPHPFTSGDLGTREFGGEPFWVSKMTAAYVRGVHEGSNGRVAVVPKYFPGHGGADRRATIEIPTIQRSLDQLAQYDLKPFYAVTGAATDPLDQAEGLLIGHIKYRGFQGDNPRLETRPISLDPQALQVLLRLPQIEPWRASGGLVISDALGVRGVRRLYDPQERVFNNRRIAQDAFNAGNDLLYLASFGLNPEVDQTSTIEDTIEYFVQQYQDDPTFAERVDGSVRRIIRTKLDLFGAFDTDSIFPPSDGLEQLGTLGQTTINTAQSAVTLLSPDQADALVAPESNERIVILTDTRTTQQCSTCPPVSEIPVDALQSSILRQYGPNATGLVKFGSIQSFSFDQLDNYLEFGSNVVSTEGATQEPDELGIALVSADWIVFVMQDVNPAVPSSDAVKRFLAETSLPANPRIVVMAMGAPYYLDSTEVSKLAGYYALYGSSRPFVDVAARALFQGLPVGGASPVSIPGLDYDILQATAPDPNQVISLSYEISRPTVNGTEEAPVDLENPQQGDTLALSTGVILDVNGHAVPDGTPVDFEFDYAQQGLRDTGPVTTVGGIAETSIPIDRAGILQISVSSLPATNSSVIQLDVPPSGPGTVTTLTPELPTPTAEPTEENSESASGRIEVTPTEEAAEPLPSVPVVGFGDLYLAAFGLMIVGAGAFAYGRARGDMNFGLLLGLPAIIGGFVGYNFYALLLPGAGLWRRLIGERLAPSAAAWLGALLGVGLTLILLRARDSARDANRLRGR